MLKSFIFFLNSQTDWIGAPKETFQEAGRDVGEPRTHLLRRSTHQVFFLDHFETFKITRYESPDIFNSFFFKLDLPKSFFGSTILLQVFE